jgi:hypothetical protein
VVLKVCVSRLYKNKAWGIDMGAVILEATLVGEPGFKLFLIADPYKFGDLGSRKLFGLATMASLR